MSSFRRFMTGTGLAAAFALPASSLSAAELPVAPAVTSFETAPAWSPGADDAQRHRHWHHRRNRGVDAGDVIAGLLIVGGIAAIANAASKNDDRNYRNRDWRYPQDARADGRYGYDGTNGIDRAIEMCVDAIERDARVETVTSADRTAQGWQVHGSLYDGEEFACSIGADSGRIEAIDYGSGFNSYDRNSGRDDWYGDENRASEDKQYNDAVYAEARARMPSPAPSQSAYSQPAYPGGPMPGDDLD